MIKLLRHKNDGKLVPNKRIKIREGYHLGGYHEGDQDVLVQYLNDLAIYKNTLNIPHPYTAKDADWWINHIQEEKKRLKLQPNWTIRNDQNQLIGGIGMVINGPAIAPHQEIGYWLGKPHRNQGIMTDAIQAMTAHCFHKYKVIESLTAHIFTDNEASMATIKKAGYTMVRLVDNHYEKSGRKIAAYEFAKAREK